MKSKKNFYRDLRVLPELLEMRRLLSSTWLITGTAEGTTGNTIDIRVSTTDSTQLVATDNGITVGSREITSLNAVRIESGDGNDTVTVDLTGTTRKIFVSVNTGAGNDYVSVSGACAVMNGGPGNDTLVGNSDYETLIGGAGDDRLQGSGQHDGLIGGTGNDTLVGAGGYDSLHGDVGSDSLFGGGEHDHLLGGSGDDTLRGGSGSNIIDGGSGTNDVFYTQGDTVLHNPADVLLPDLQYNAFHQFQSNAEFDQWLIDSAVQQWSGEFGQSAYWWYFTPGVFDTSTDAGGVLAAAPGESAAGGDSSLTLDTSHSTTNDQVAGVDEADLVQTDGTYIYTITSGELVIADANPADQMSVVSATPIDGSASGIFLDGNYVTVLSSVWSWNGNPDNGTFARPGVIMDWLFPGNEQTIVTTYNVTDPTAPVITQQNTLDGYLVDSRQIGDEVYVATNKSVWLPAPDMVDANGNPVDASQAPPDGTHYYYESESAYLAKLQALDITQYLPQYSTTAGGTTTTGPLLTLPQVYVSGTGDDDESLTSIATFNVADGSAGPQSTATIAGPSGAVYATSQNLYLTGWSWDEDTGQEKTELAKFNLDNPITLSAVGEVDGSIIDQYSLGEYQGNLQVATTDWWDDDSSSNNVFILSQQNDQLNVIGSLVNIAPGEELASSRFMGSEGYLITSNQTDPLYTLDLSNPQDPSVQGQLTIPGFSSYLQMLNNNDLLALGEDSNGQLQLLLFNVSNPASPAQIGSYSFATSNDPDTWTGSAAQYDPHAIGWFPEYQELVLPTWTYGDDGSYQEGLSVLKVDFATGFTSLGQVTQTDPQRGVRIGDVLYAIGSSDIQAVNLADPTKVIASVSLPSPPDDTGDGGTVVTPG